MPMIGSVVTARIAATSSGRWPDAGRATGLAALAMADM